jgi:hypothetical protein
MVGRKERIGKRRIDTAEFIEFCIGCRVAMAGRPDGFYLEDGNGRAR